MVKLVIGNAAIDHIISNEVHYEFAKDTATLRYGNNVFRVMVEKGPIMLLGKYNATIPLNDIVNALPSQIIFGGGAYSSVKSLQILTDDEVWYLDPSSDGCINGVSYTENLKSSGINTCFLSARPIPHSIVLEKRSNKVILQSPLYKKGFDKEQLQTANGLIRDSSNILVNSLCDEEIFELVLQSLNAKKTLLTIVTKSLSPDYVLEKVVPNSVCQFNYDEVGIIINPDHKVYGDETERIESSMEGLKKIRADYCPSYNLYVTLGKHGTLCANSLRMCHIRLKDEILEDVCKFIETNAKELHGAGSAFGASLLINESLGLPLEDITKNACIHAIKHLGYTKKLDCDNFVCDAVR